MVNLFITKKSIITTLVAVIVSTLASTAHAGLFDFFGASKADKEHYQRVIVDKMREKMVSKQLKDGRILGYDYIKEESVPFANGTKGRLVFTVIPTDSTNYGKYHLLTVTLFRIDKEKLIHDDFHATWIKSAKFNGSSQEQGFDKLLSRAQRGLVANGYTIASIR